MKEYKRFTHKKIDLDKLSDKAKSRISDTYLEYAKTNNAFWELENKIENGTLKFLHCKVGDNVYFVDEKKWCWEMIVVEIAILKKHIVYKIGNGRKELRYVYDEDLGKKWFLTEPEAEKKLKELQNEMS